MYKLLFILFCYADVAFCQCQAILPFSEKEMDKITDVYQFTFLHKTPQNKLDSCVKQLMYPQMIIDSNYFDWSLTSPRVVNRIDLMKFKNIVDDIGKLKTQEAFLILNLGYMLPFKIQDDLSMYASFCSNLNYFGATDAINKYYLDSAISIKLSRPTFDNAVMAKASLLRKEMFKEIKYCQPLIGNDRYLYEMQQYNPSYQDSIIEKTISKYLNHFPNVPGYFFLDSVMIEILQLPFVHDAQWDNCVVKASDDSHVPPLQLGVIIAVGRDEFNQKKFIQRVYAVGRDEKRNSVLLPAKYDVDFVSRTRRQCEGIEEEIELKLEK